MAVFGLSCVSVSSDILIVEKRPHRFAIWSHLDSLKLEMPIEIMSINIEQSTRRFTIRGYVKSEYKYLQHIRIEGIDTVLCQVKEIVNPGKTLGILNHDRVSNLFYCEIELDKASNIKARPADIYDLIDKDNSEYVIMYKWNKK